MGDDLSRQGKLSNVFSKGVTIIDDSVVHLKIYVHIIQLLCNIISIKSIKIESHQMVVKTYTKFQNL